MEKSNEIEEQSSSKSIVTDKPQETTDASQQEEPPDEKPTKLTTIKGSPSKKSNSISKDIKGKLELEFDFMKIRENQEKERKKKLNLPENPLDDLLKDKVRGKLKDKK